jgi:hypothetical protein
MKEKLSRSRNREEEETVKKQEQRRKRRRKREEAETEKKEALSFESSPRFCEGKKQQPKYKYRGLSQRPERR